MERKTLKNIRDGTQVRTRIFPGLAQNSFNLCPKRPLSPPPPPPSKAGEQQGLFALADLALPTPPQFESIPSLECLQMVGRVEVGKL